MAREEWKYSVYEVTCVVSGRVYVGMTGKSISRRWTEHLRNAARGLEYGLAAGIRKYGKEAFCVREVAKCPTEENGFLIERALIAGYRAAGVFLYNMTSGGDGAPDLSPESQEKKRRSIVKALANPEVKAKQISGVLRSNTPEVMAKRALSIKKSYENPDVVHRKRLAIQKSRTPEVAAKLSASIKKAWADPEKRARLLPTEETRAKISAAGKGRVFSEDHKAKMREAALKRWAAVRSAAENEGQ